MIFLHQKKKKVSLLLPNLCDNVVILEPKRKCLRNEQMVIKRIQEPKSFFQHLLAKRKVVDQRLHSIKEELLKRKNGNDEIEDEKEMTWKGKVKKKSFGKFLLLLLLLFFY